ncbi:ATP-dependent helicase [Mycobacterium sp. M1]|uniref:DNA 3'-5' helicase n=1 Tax=Mycolicibacter acidiphilus TaxID=2835306 RepID=A0ABS5RH83_9MYCO|nr:UvrD-helicase domain-containing protein [Mycolicibacter acidiphilus]MBS9533642.1 ATP-dependent helicase [Mycolicibacter acidiphilus]
MTPRYAPVDLADALGLHRPTEEQAAVIAAPPGPLVVIAGAGAGKTETMAARVVWLVANGYAEPGQVLGLTFTKKAAGQLLRRVRSRLARLAGAGLMTGEPTGGAPDSPDAPTPTVSTYDAFAGALLREHGLLIGIEPSTRLLTATGFFQLVLDVVNNHPGALATDKDPAAIASMVLRLNGQLAEHLVDTDALRDTHRELEQLITTLPPGPRQRSSGPTKELLKLLDAQTGRADLVPIIDALHRRMRAERVTDFGVRMSAAARLASTCGSVGEQLRATYRVVLLDEYQDTGHAQRVALSALFGGGVDDGLALTAVGDPIQSIYGWRGASATNLPRFATDFPLSDGSPAPTLQLRTSWRNPAEVLQVANAVSAEARSRSVDVRTLRPRPDAPPGTVRAALLPDVVAEREWVAEHLAQCYQRADAAGVAPPTAAVLVRRNADAAPIAEAIRARGVPVEVVGLAGLLSVPEVADLVAMLRLIAEPTAGPAAVRVLTGPRWRLGAADLAALWHRARELRGTGRTAGPESPTEIAAQADPDERDDACLADALADPGAPERYSAVGYRRIEALAGELSTLRAQLWQPLPDFVAEVRRVLGLDCEVRARCTPTAAETSETGTEHLDAFADVVAGYADPNGSAIGPTPATVPSLLAYLDLAEEQEKGLTSGAPAVVADRVQVLTVHTAKGLEWQVVAVPHLVDRVFPSNAARRSWLGDPGELPPLLRGDRASAGDHGVPVLDVSTVVDRKQLSDTIVSHQAQLDRRRVDEERRLLYVAVTRAEDTLLVSGHHWGATETKPRGPSDFLTEVKAVIDESASSGQPCGVVEHWAQTPADGDSNPLRDNVVEASWPVDPLGARRRDVADGAALVAAAMTAEPAAVDSVWTADVEALLAERARAGEQPEPVLPNQVSVSNLVELSRDPDGAVQRISRRLPARPDPHALLGTEFHGWVQRFYGADRLFDLADLPGAADTDVAVADAEQLAALQDAFRASSWADRTPVAVEVPFEMMLDGTVVRGRIDAVFADPDGTVTVVDWKTGAAPDGADARRQAAVQLGVYRLAWAALAGCDESAVRAAFHYVRSGVTVVPDTLPGPAELAALLHPQPG